MLDHFLNSVAEWAWRRFVGRRKLRLLVHQAYFAGATERQLLAEGKAMAEIDGTLNMTTRTVAFHKYRIMDVLGAKSNAELVRYAVRNHLIAA